MYQSSSKKERKQLSILKTHSEQREVLQFRLSSINIEDGLDEDYQP